MSTVPRTKFLGMADSFVHFDTSDGDDWTAPEGKIGVAIKSYGDGDIDMVLDGMDTADANTITFGAGELIPGILIKRVYASSNGNSDDLEMVIFMMDKEF